MLHKEYFHKSIKTCPLLISDLFLDCSLLIPSTVPSWDFHHEDGWQEKLAQLFQIRGNGRLPCNIWLNQCPWSKQSKPRLEMTPKLDFINLLRLWSGEGICVSGRCAIGYREQMDSCAQSPIGAKHAVRWLCTIRVVTYNTGCPVQFEFWIINKFFF